MNCLDRMKKGESVALEELRKEQVDQAMLIYEDSLLELCKKRHIAEAAIEQSIKWLIDNEFYILEGDRVKLAIPDEEVEL